MKKLILLFSLVAPGHLFGLVDHISEQETTRLNTLLVKIAQPKVSRIGKEAQRADKENILRVTISFNLEVSR